MNGRLIETFVLTYVYDRGKCEAAAFDQCAYLDDLPSKDIKIRRLQIHVNDDAIANVDRLHAKQHRVQHAERTASP